MRLTLFIIFCLISVTGNSQTSYAGHIGKSPITLVMYHYSDGATSAYYAYDAYDTPITIDGHLEEGVLKLFEKDNSRNISATLTFETFDQSDGSVRGVWTNADHSKTYPITLHKDFDITDGDSLAWTNKELLQSGATQEHYFKTLITKKKGEREARISAVKIFEKRTDQLIQTIELDCQLFGIDNISIGDYNFDGTEDFSVFEASYAGANTSSIYVLRDPASDNYFKANFTGTSLAFDHDLQLIYEHNQCCAGRGHMVATYKVIDNEMILVERKCFEFDPKKDDFIKVVCN